MGDTTAYKGIGGWLALRYRLWQGNNQRRIDVLNYRIARRLPRGIKLYVLANACGDARTAKGGTVEPDRVTYSEMCATVLKWKEK
jgi:hypothetical protein